VEVVSEKFSTFFTTVTIEYSIVCCSEIIVEVKVMDSGIAVFEVWPSSFVTDDAGVEPFDVELKGSNPDSVARPDNMIFIFKKLLINPITFTNIVV
jgi:hypothetical protein